MERKVKFNFGERRRQRTEEKEAEVQKQSEREANLAREAKQLSEAIQQHFSQGELTVTQSGPAVKVVRRGTGETITVTIKDRGLYRLSAQGDKAAEAQAKNKAFMMEVGESEMMDAVEDWSKS